MQIKMDVEECIHYSDQQRKAIAQLPLDKPDISGINAFVFDEKFSMDQIVAGRNQEVWTNWFFSFFSLKDVDREDEFEYFMDRIETLKKNHLLGLCVTYDNHYFFTALIRYIHFMEEVKKNNLKKEEYRSIHFRTNHDAFEGCSFENYLLSTYNVNTLKSRYEYVMNVIYNDIVKWEELIFM